MDLKTVPVKEVYERHQQGKTLDVIDVRTPAEFREVHAPFARNVPLDVLDPARLNEDRNGTSGEPLYVICRSGSRAAKACQKLFASGVADVVSIEGGMQAWEAAGLPVVRGKKTISLERQVRIAAGFLVVLGAALSLIHPAFVALSAFVGAGLMYSGITDTCGMAMTLAKMPWNRVGGDGQACSA